MYIILLLIILYLINKPIFESFYNYPNVYVKSKVDGINYKIIGAFQDKQGAADLLGKTNIFIKTFLSILKNKYIKQNNADPNKKKIVELLLKQYNPNNVSENNPKDSLNTSFVFNKGEKISFCLREKESGANELHTFESLKFVAMHEIAHIGTINNGHKMDFWRTFKFLLYEAALAGIYNPIDYSKYPMKYCSVDVTYNPLYDIHL